MNSTNVTWSEPTTTVAAPSSGTSLNDSSYDALDQMLFNQTVNFTYPPVNAGVGTEITALVVLIVGVVGNVVVMMVFLWRPWGRTPLQVDRVVGLLALTGLATTLTSVPVQLYSFSTTVYPASDSVCQLQGFLLNLLCLLCLWYTTVLAVERYVKFASPHEHTLTFSPLNLNVVLSGVLVLLLIEVSGPIYGWAEYGYVEDLAMCVLNPQSTHIFTYTVIQTVCYVSFPVCITIVACISVLHRCQTDPAPLTRGSQVLKSDVGISVLCGAMLMSVLFMLPYHVLLMTQSAEVEVPVWSKVLSYWMKIVSLTCVYPSVLLLARPREVWPPLMATLHNMKRCRVRGFLQDKDGDLDLSNIGVAGVDESMRKARRISKSSHMTDTTILSASPSHSAKDSCPPSSVSRL
ncbi:pinopsin-like [Macrobrachium nipponense]|uniref:pinopsin-like n=1 Tax=Macrobrachium nipponense TaxID=159736 RepID=UPI0030C83F76